MEKRIIPFITIILLVLIIALPCMGWAEGTADNAAGRVMVRLVGQTGNYVRAMNSGIGAKFKWLFQLFILGWIASIAVRAISGNPPNYITSLTKLFVVMLAGALALNADLFMSTIYEPLTGMMFAVPGFLLHIVAGGEGITTPSQLMNALFATSGKFISVGMEGLDSMGVMNMSFGQFIMYMSLVIGGYMLSISYTVILIISVIYANIFIALSPIALMAMPFEKTHFLFLNIIRGYFKYAAVPSVGALVVALTYTVTKDIAAETYATKALSYDLWSEAMLIIMITVILVWNSYGIAQELVTGAGSTDPALPGAKALTFAATAMKSAKVYAMRGRGGQNHGV